MQQVNRSEELIPVQEKYALTIREASEYFSIGIKKMRRLAEDNLGRFAIYSGNRYLIIRTKFEKIYGGNFYDITSFSLPKVVAISPV